MFNYKQVLHRNYKKKLNKTKLDFKLKAKNKYIIYYRVTTKGKNASKAF